MRTSRPDDFTVSVDGVGDFTFSRRTMRDQFAIDTEIAKLTGGIPNVPPYLAMYADAMACIKVLTVTAPEKWDVEKLDPLEEESYSQLLAVHAALRDKEDTFRKKPAAGSEAGREGDGKVGGILVSEEVQPTAE